MERYLRNAHHTPRILIVLLLALHLAAFAQKPEEATPGKLQPQRPLPPGKPGEWVLEMRSSGGIFVRVSTLLIRSDGHFEKKEAFKTSVQTGTLPAPALTKLNQAILAARLSSWKTDYNPPGDNGCCDRIRTSLKLRVCGADGKWTKYQGGWYTLSSPPPDLKAVLDATEF